MIPVIPTSILLDALPADRHDTSHELSGLARLVASITDRLGRRHAAQTGCTHDGVLTADRRSDLTTAS